MSSKRLLRLDPVKAKAQEMIEHTVSMFDRDDVRDWIWDMFEDGERLDEEWIDQVAAAVESARVIVKFNDER